MPLFASCGSTEVRVATSFVDGRADSPTRFQFPLCGERGALGSRTNHALPVGHSLLQTIVRYGSGASMWPVPRLRSNWSSLINAMTRSARRGAGGVNGARRRSRQQGGPGTAGGTSRTGDNPWVEEASSTQKSDLVELAPQIRGRQLAAITDMSLDAGRRIGPRLCDLFHEVTVWLALRVSSDQRRQSNANRRISCLVTMRHCARLLSESLVKTAHNEEGPPLFSKDQRPELVPEFRRGRVLNI